MTVSRETNLSTDPRLEAYDTYDTYDDVVAFWQDVSTIPHVVATLRPTPSRLMVLAWLATVSTMVLTYVALLAALRAYGT